MAIVIETRSRASVDDVWGEWAVASDTSDMTDTSTVEYRVYQTYSVDYVTEYVAAYEQLVNTSMESVGDDKDSILEKQFALLDDSDEHLTQKEIVAAKNQAYGNLRAQIMVNSQKTAMALVEKQFRFSKELQSQDKQLEILGYQAERAANDASYVLAQKTALEEQVIDNRNIKALDSLADTYGTAMAGGLKVTTEMWSTYFDIVLNLTNGTIAEVSDPGGSTVVVPA